MPTLYELWLFCTDAVTAVFFLGVICAAIFVYTIFIVIPFSLAGLMGRSARSVYCFVTRSDVGY